MDTVAAPDRSYAIVTPVRNEARFVQLTIDSVLNQVLPPVQWVIVDDGSTDATPTILSEQTTRVPWIRVITLPDRGYSMRGEGVATALARGLEEIDAADYQYLVKLDADVSFDQDYFLRLIERFEADPGLGIASGAADERHHGRLRELVQSRDTALGATRVWRRRCFEDIGGVPVSWGWDAIDEKLAAEFDWRSASFGDIRFEHHKVQGLRNKYEHGCSAYAMGSHPAYVVARGVWRMKDSPLVLGGLALIAGYGVSAVKRAPRFGDAEYRRRTRNADLRRLTHKTRARMLGDSGESVAGSDTSPDGEVLG